MGDKDLQIATLAELGLQTASLLHELRQPLFAAKAHAQLLQRGALGCEGLDAILAQLAHIEALISDYTDLSPRVETESLYDLNEPVRGAIAMLGPRGRRSQAVLQSELCEQALLVRGRRSATKQVAVNLIANALDATSSVHGGRGLVVVRTSSLSDGRVCLEVEDDGPGVPDELVERVFEPFVTTKAPGAGTGLGLYITRRLVHEAHGEMQVDRGRVGGALFRVALPRAA